MARREYFYLVDQREEEWPLWTEKVTIGSGDGNVIVLAEPGVAGVQTHIWRALGRCWIRDEVGAFGTLLNGHPVHGERELRPGDVIEVGSRAFRVVVRDSLPQRLPPKPSTRRKTATGSKGKRPAKRAPAARPALTTPSAGKARERKAVPPIAIIAPVAVLLILLVTALLSRSGSGQSTKVRTQNATSDADGQAQFRHPESERELAIVVLDEYGFPRPDIEVAYLHGEAAPYEAFFALFEGQVSGAAFFLNSPDVELHWIPNLMHKASASHAQAIAGFLVEGGFGPETYQGTVSRDEYEASTQPKAAVRVEVYRNGQVFYGVEDASLPGAYGGLGAGVEVGSGQWDQYTFTLSDRKAGLDLPVVAWAQSQPPVMSQLGAEATTEGAVRISMLAIDPWAYAGVADPEQALGDQTLVQGPTSSSDLVYHYRILDETGSAIVGWSEVEQQAVCQAESCKVTELQIEGLLSGTYILEAYAVDEVGNGSEVTGRAFAIGE